MELLNLSNYTVRQLRQITQKDEAFLLILNSLFFLCLSVRGKEDDIEGFYFEVPELRISYDEIIPSLEEGFSKLQTRNSELNNFFDDTIYFLSKHRNNQILANLLLNFFMSLSRVNDISETIKKEEEFSLFFEKFIAENLPKGHFPTPKILVEFLVKLANPEIADTIYSPNARIGNILTRINKDVDRNLTQIFAQEPYALSYKIAVINCIINGGYNVDLKNENPLFFLREGLLNRYDLVISVPPFGQKLRGDSKYLVQDNLKFSPLRIRTGDDAYLQLMMGALNENGRMVTIVPEGILVSSMYQEWREYYINKDWIEAIISLPNKMFAPNSRIKTSILIINKNKSIKSKNRILFLKLKNPKSLSIDTISEASTLYRQWQTGNLQNISDKEFISFKIALKDELQKSSFKLSSEIYAHSSYEELNNILASTTYEVKKVNDFIDEISMGVSPTIANSRRNIKDKSHLLKSSLIPYIKSSDLTAIATSESKKLDLEKLETIPLNIIKSKKKKYLISEDVVLINRLGRSLNSFFFKYEGTPVVINPNVIALHLKKDINPRFFVAQLSSKVVQLQFELQSSGTVINRIGIKELKNISIIVPPASEQERQILELEALAKTEQKLKTTETQTKKEISEIEFNVVATISHNLNQKLGQMVADMESLKEFLNRKDNGQQNISWTEPAAIVFADENPEDVDSLEILFTRLESTLGDATKTLKTTEEILQKNKINPEKTNLLTFFREVKKDSTGANFIIEIRGKRLEVELDRAAFKDAMRNLISNAKKHGFKEVDKEYCIVFDWNQFTDENTGDKKVRITYQNDGAPFPKDFSFEEYIKLTGRAGKNRGSGLGGFWINKVVQLHKGIFQQGEVSEREQLQNIHFEIILPIKQNKNIWI